MNRPARIVNCDSVCRAKLRSERGASIILALVLFLICAMVAGVIVSGASVNVERTTQEVAEEQAYLDLRSAGQAVQALFKPAGDTDQKVSIVSVDITDIDHPVFQGNSLLVPGGKGDNVARWIVDSAIQVRKGNTPGNLESTITYQSPYGNEPNEVAVSFLMDDQYKITAELSLVDQSNNATQLEVVVRATLTKNIDGEVTNVTWSNPKLHKVVK